MTMGGCLTQPVELKDRPGFFIKSGDRHMKLQLPLAGILFALAACRPAPAEVFGKGKEGAGDEARFSADELRLLEIFSRAYELNGKLVRPKTMQEGLPTVVELTRSENRRVRELAEMGLVQSQLARLYQQNRSDLQSAFEKQYRDEWPKVFLKMLASAAQTDRPQDVREAAKLVEELIGNDAQRTANQGLALLFFGKALGRVQNDKIRSLAQRAPLPGADQRITIKVLIDPTPRRFGSWRVTNTSRKDLHHCVILTRAVPDLDKLGTDAGTELLLNELILPPAGFERRTVNGAQQAVVLRTMIAALSSGTILYVPRLPAGGTVVFQSSCALPITKSGDVSLWCDEGTVDGQGVGNWEQVKAMRQR
jgi:hypothetical protein